jgi:hypothetical protein
MYNFLIILGGTLIFVFLIIPLILLLVSGSFTWKNIKKIYCILFK